MKNVTPISVTDRLEAGAAMAFSHTPCRSPDLSEGGHESLGRLTILAVGIMRSDALRRRTGVGSKISCANQRSRPWAVSTTRGSLSDPIRAAEAATAMACHRTGSPQGRSLPTDGGATLMLRLARNISGVAPERAKVWPATH